MKRIPLPKRSLPNFCTKAEIARYLRCSRWTVDSMLADNLLPNASIQRHGKRMYYSGTNIRRRFASRQLLDIHDVMEALGVSRSKVWTMIKRGELPAPRHITETMRRWRIEDVEELLIKPLEEIARPLSGFFCQSRE